MIIPKNLKTEGRKFWKKILSEYELSKSHDFELLAEACECLDRMASCRIAIDADGEFQKNKFGRIIEHPALKIEKAQKQLFLSIVRELGLTIKTDQARKSRLY